MSSTLTECALEGWPSGPWRRFRKPFSLTGGAGSTPVPSAWAALVAQMDRVQDSGSWGRRFESSRVRLDIMKFEFSAGGVVYRKTSQGIDVLMCQHSQHHGWGFPKGLIGDKKDGETKEETAIREVEEETGAKGKIIEAIEPVTYWYQWEGEKVKKTVYFFVMEYRDGDITKHDFEMEDVKWVEIEKVFESLTFKSDKEVFNRSKPLIMKFANS